MSLTTRTRQAAVLVGGKGTRLGALTRATPKPLMEIRPGVVFLDILLQELIRQGFDDIILLAGYLGEQLCTRYAKKFSDQAHIRVVIEDQPLGTAGAVRNVAALLGEYFLLLNGDTFFSFNYRALEQQLTHSPSADIAMALCHVNDCRRYGSVMLDGETVLGFREKAGAGSSDAATEGWINAGAYFCSRQVLDMVAEGENVSLETALMPALVAKRRVLATGGHGYFIDIGLPETLERCQREYDAIVRRPALFLDRDGTINIDKGYTHKTEDFVTIPGAMALIRYFCDAGWHVFVVTNQAGIAKGHYQLTDMEKFHEHLRDYSVSHAGAFIQDVRHCPYHADAVVPELKVADHPDRKPNPGMIESLIADWPVDLAHSLLIGDMPSDIAAGEAAGVRSLLFKGEDLWVFAKEAGVVTGERPDVSD